MFDFAALCILKYERKRKAEKMKELQDRINKRKQAYEFLGRPVLKYAILASAINV